MTTPNTPKTPGYTKKMMIMPFDHRGSFAEKLFGIVGRAPTADETREIARYKRCIFEGYELALARGVPKNESGILVDEQFGHDILIDAKNKGYLTACPAEKSGQDEFDFEYGPEFGAHIAKYNVDFVKVLVRYNTEADAAMNQRQAARLKQLSDYCHQNHRNFMFELLVPPTDKQLKDSQNSKAVFDQELRPELTIRAIAQIQKAGIEPDVWKLEGLETRNDCENVVAACHAQGRNGVGVIVLGRGENEAKVKHWLATGAKIKGMIGFAVGRTIFWEPLKAMKDQKFTYEQAKEKIAENYKALCDLWTSEQNSVH